MKNYPEQEAKSPKALASLDWKRQQCLFDTSITSTIWIKETSQNGENKI
jgi:hypothetical protein